MDSSGPVRIVHGGTLLVDTDDVVRPDPRYPQLTDRATGYAGRLDEVTVDGEQLTPQPGRFYGGWITADVVGPFKGEPGSWGW